MAINSTSFTKTPQANDDWYYWGEDDLLSSGLYNISTNVLTLDVMSNDLGGKAKVLYSIEDGDGNPLDLTDADVANGVSDWEATASGNLVRINNGKIELDVTNTLPGGIDSLGAGEPFTDTFVYAIRLANGTLSWAHVQVTVVGSNDAPTDLALDNTSVDENAAGAVIGVVTVTDPDVGDTFTFAVDDPRFEVVGGNLKLKAGESLDHETEPSVSVKVTVTDAGGLSYDETFTITVNNVNELGPVTDGDAADNTVAENAAIGTVVGVTGLAIDPDAGDTVSYSLDDDAGGLFAIDATTGVVTVAGALDYETATSHDITIRATDNHGLSTTQIFTIAVTDVLETDPNDFDDKIGSNNPTQGSDTVVGTTGDDNISGLNGHDTIYGKAGNDTLTGNNDNDVIYGGSGDDTINGNNGTDQLFGGSGSDTVTGGGDDDLIIGGYGSDTLTGQGGTDTFRYLSLNDGSDTITDFNMAAPGSGGDIIDISSILDLPGSTWIDGTSFDDAVTGGYLTFTDDGGKVQVNVDIDPTDSVSAVAIATLTNVNYAGFVASTLSDNVTLD